MNNPIKSRALSIRARTIALTLAIVITLIFYFCVSIFTRQNLNWVNFAFLLLVQILTHCAYFPDGEIYGEKDEKYIKNRTSYNDKATSINRDCKVQSLREYCDYEFEQRKHQYLLNELGYLGLTEDEFNALKSKTEKEVMSLKNYEVNGRFIAFNRKRRNKLYKLIFKDLRVEKNDYQTIMSAVENSGNKAIHDESKRFKAFSYASRFISFILVALLFAYIGYTARDGFGMAEIVNIFMYLTTMISTGVMAYSSGEISTKVYKSRFYLKLANFIDGFNEWDKKERI